MKRRRDWIVVAVVAALLAVGVVLVGTAMPGIVRDLSGLALYSWPFTAYLISSTVATLVFGKISDSSGRKPMRR